MSAFITLEGIEGSGKSTQVRLLAEALRAQGHTVVETREPGGTGLGEELRRLLLLADVPIDPVSEAYLMTAARAEHVREVVRPALRRGEIVVSDRFADSTFAYQGAGRRLPIEELRRLQTLAVGPNIPDVTVLLELPVSVGLSRRRAEGDVNRIDSETIEFHERVAAWFSAEARRDTQRWIIVDAAQTPAMVHTAVFEGVWQHLQAGSVLQSGIGR